MRFILVSRTGIESVSCLHSPGNERGSSLTLGAKRMSVFDGSTLYVLTLGTHAFAGGAQ